jgi:sulfur carrier protein ThiS
MKTMKNVICTVLIGLALVAQLVSPTQAYADEGKHKHKGEHHHPTTPATTEAAATGVPKTTHTPIARTAEPTEVSTELVATETPTEVVDTEGPVATETPTEVVVTEKPNATDIPATEVPAATQVPTETSATEVPGATETTAPTEAPAESAATQALLETATTEQTTLPDVLEQMPTDTSVVVLDENGQPLPLATQAAADAIAAGDPMWCPPGVAPGGAGCTGSYTSLATLLSDLSAQNSGTGVNSDGVIWIESTYDSSVNDPTALGFTLDGSVLTTWSTHALTLQGGWDGNLGSTTILPSNSIFSVPIGIFSWTGNVAVNNVTVQNTTSSGLYVDTAGTIAANNIIADNNSYIGAALLGKSGVTVTGVNEFNNNANSGLWAVSDGNITLNQSLNDSVVAIGNGVYGADLYSNFGAITLNQIMANGNLRGVLAFASGTITASNITANGNVFRGVYLFGESGVTMTGSNQFRQNGVHGFWDVSGAFLRSSFGSVTLAGTNVFDSNGSIGAGLHGKSGVTVTGSNQFLYNGDSGLWAVSDGNITLNQSLNNSVTAIGNGVYGADLYSNFGSVTVTGINQFNGNRRHGLIVYSPGGITVTGTNQFSNNLGNGLVVGSNGPITLNSIAGTGNTTDVFLFSPDSATVNSATVSSLDATAVCGTLALNGVLASNISYPVAGEHTFVDTYGITRTIDCHPIIYVNGHLLGELPQVAPTQYEFDLSCGSQTLYPVDLPNGDKVTIVCPVQGRAVISRLDNTTIPNDLPAGYTYASAFSVAVLQADEPIPLITEGGHVEVSFKVPSQGANSYSILFWDNGAWVPLSDFLLSPDNKPQTFDLNPGISTDLRKILSGVQLITKDGVQRVEVSTNFPGVFALAQH